MNNKGYTIMEAVIAMFLVVVMVGAVFSALMSSRRAIVSSSEKEEILYSINSAYALLKDCRANPACHLGKFGCKHAFDEAAEYNWAECNELFTFNFGNVCKDNNGELSYKLVSDNLPESFYEPSGTGFGCETNKNDNFYQLSINATCVAEE